MPTAVIGALRVDLDLGTAGWKSGLNSAQKDAQGAKAKFESVGKGIATAGAALTVGVTAPFTALLRTAIPAATESAQAMGQVEAALKSMGPVAGRTKEQLADAATELMHLSTFDDDDILRKVTANLLTFGTIAGEQFDRAQVAAADLSTRMGGDLQSATLLIGKALNDPIKGMGALRKVGIQLSDQQKEQVKAFVASGNAAAAQGVILTELEKQFGGSAKAMRAATPGIEAKQNWDDFTEVVGGLALKVLPTLTDMLATALGLFNNLDPTVQAVAVGGVALLAALGPIAGGVGLLISGFGGLIPILMGTAAAEAATAAGLTAVEAAAVPMLATVLPVLAAVAGAVALGYAAWQNWDTIGPMLGDWASGVAERTGEAIKWLESIFDWINKLNGSGGVTGPFVQQSAVDNAKSQFSDINKSSDDFLARLKSETFSTWEAIDKKFRDTQKWADDFDAAAVRMWKSFENMHARAQAAFNRMVDGISGAIRGKLSEAMTWAEDKARAVGDAFYSLYDRVVGHSYVPDMVDGIADEMRRLDGVMVDPAAKATGKVAANFKKMRDDLKPLLDELFPEIRDSMEQANKLDLIERARKAGTGNGGLSDDQAAEARRRVFNGSEPAKNPFADVGELAPEHIELVKDGLDDLKKTLPDLSKTTSDTTAKMVESFAGMAKDVLGSVRGMVGAFKGGDILGGITGLLDVVQQVSGIIGGLRTPRATVNTVPLGGGRALGGPVVPGKRYRVGEKGPEWLEVNQPGRIVPNNDGGGGGNVYHISGNLLTPEFWDKIQAGHDNAALRGANGGAQLAMERTTARRQRSLYG